MRERIDAMLFEQGIEYDKEHSLFRDNKLVYYEDDQYSGRRYEIYIDEYGYLYQSMSDDSPEQCGGWVDVNIYKDGKKYVLNNIADKWDYAVLDGRVYLIELDDCCAEQTITIEHINSEDSKQGREEVYRRQVSYSMYVEVLNSDLKAFIKTKLNCQDD